MFWSTKEKFCLLFDILEFGDQNESWMQISADLNRKFLSNALPSSSSSSPIKRESKYSIKNCKEEYRSLVEQYKSRWIDEQEKCAKQWKTPLVKFIFQEFKSIYLKELISQIKDSRKKILDMCLQLEPTINLKSQRNDSFQIPSAVEIAPELSFESQTNDLADDKVQFEVPTQSVPEDSIDPLKTEETTSSSSSETPQPPFPLSIPMIVDDVPKDLPSQIKVEPNVEMVKEDSTTPMPLEPTTTTTETSSSNEETPPIDSNDNSSSLPATTPNETKSTGETKSESSKKYHIYFCPNNSTTSTNGATKGKAKRKNVDEKKDEDEMEPTTPSESVPSTPTSQGETSKATVSMTTRRTANIRSTPNPLAEQEEEKSRRFSAMLTENPNSWQSQANSIIQYLLSQKQGYLFENEITDEIAPKYHLFIRRPIALDTIRKTLESNLYENKEHFKRDVFLMLYNAMKYNPRHHHVHRSAKTLFLQALPLFNLSNEDIQGQIVRRNSTHHNDLPAAKRKRIK